MKRLLTAVCVTAFWAAGGAGAAWAQQGAELIEPGPLVLDAVGEQPVTYPSTDDYSPTDSLLPGMGVEDCGVCSICGEAGPCACRASCCDGFCCLWLNSTCDMPQHHPYCPPLHGYYYFRPYNVAHVAAQQQFVASFGGDVRDPYANRVFQTVYSQYQAERTAPTAPEDAVPLRVPSTFETPE